LGLEVQEASTPQAPPCTAARIFELLRAWANGGSHEEGDGLAVALNKAVRLPLDFRAAAEHAALKALIALAPLREDSSFFPASAIGASTLAPLSGMVNQQVALS